MRSMVVASVLLAAVCVALVATARAPGATCGPGFFAVGHRCCPAVSGDGNACGPARTCPAPLVLVHEPKPQCVAPPTRVFVPETRFVLGPSDWESGGAIPAREVHVGAFWLDAFELTVGDGDDPARALGGLSRDEAQAICTARGGRLPTEDEWVAAAGSRGTRYPWGDTGAVCRRAAWGLVDGPCTHGASGPDTVGSHGDGDGAFHDLAGNVAEWVAGDDPARGVVVGGSYADQLAASLRVWSRKVVNPGLHAPTIGARCAYAEDAKMAP